MARQRALEYVANFLERCERGVDWCASIGGRFHRWWQRWWLWVVGIPLVCGVGIVIDVMWTIAGQPVPGVSELFAQMQMVISGTQAIIALVVGLTVMYSAKTAAEAARHSRQQDVENAQQAREGRALAFLGAVLDIAAYGSTLATMQEEGLKQRLIAPRGQEELRVATWRDLMAASAAAAKALEHLRYADDDALEPAEELFKTAVAIVQEASEGKPSAVQTRAVAVRDGANQLQALTKKPVPAS